MSKQWTLEQLKEDTLKAIGSYSQEDIEYLTEEYAHKLIENAKSLRTDPSVIYGMGVVADNINRKYYFQSDSDASTGCGMFSWFCDFSYKMADAGKCSLPGGNFDRKKFSK